MNTKHIISLALLLAGSIAAQEPQQPAAPSFEDARAESVRQLQDSVAELGELRDDIAAEKVPLSRQLSALEAELVEVRLEFQQASRLLDSRALDLNNLRNEIEAREDETGYLRGLLGDYGRNFESRLHIVEMQRYEEPIEAAKLAPENSNLSEQEIFEAQSRLITVSLDRLFDALGGSRFAGRAVADGLVEEGQFVLIGPAALFRSDDGLDVGTAEQRLGSLEPAEIDFSKQEDTLAAADLVSSGEGLFPLDPTLGNAHKIAAIEETFIEHVSKGGAVMIPIFAMAGAALLVALWKWLSMAFVRRPSRKKVESLLNAVADHDKETAERKAAAIKGPVGKMLQNGAAHLGEPRELIEEVMYENVLTTRFKLNGLLPFIAICAASAPLLGLLGTVTGIINTFQQITVFGTGDPKTLSGGISEALITTKFGLIVAIPSLLLHAFLSRKARGVIGHMERIAVSFVNQVSKSPFGKKKHAVIVPPAPAAELDEEQVRAQVSEIVSELLGPLVKDATAADGRHGDRPAVDRDGSDPREAEPVGRDA